MFLDKYIEEHGKSTDYPIFQENDSCIVQISTKDLFLSQFVEGRYNAIDVIVKLLAIENYYGQNDFGFDLYQKMQKKRTNVDWNDRFKNLILSVEKNGFDFNSYIETEINYSIHDGAHRLALALYYNIDKLNVKIFNSNLLRRKYTIEWFYDNGFKANEIITILSKLKETTKKSNAPYYCIFWPPAREIFEKLENEILVAESGIQILNKENLFFTQDEFKKFMYDIYNTDDILKYKLDLKYNFLMNSLNSDNYKSELFPITLLSTEIDIPDFRMKPITGLPQSQKTMRIKKKLRNDNCDLVTNYYYDIIMHMTDNTIQNDDVEKILRKYNRK